MENYIKSNSPDIYGDWTIKIGKPDGPGIGSWLRLADDNTGGLYPFSGRVGGAQMPNPIGPISYDKARKEVSFTITRNQDPKWGYAEYIDFEGIVSGSGDCMSGDCIIRPGYSKEKWSATRGSPESRSG